MAVADESPATADATELAMALATAYAIALALDSLVAAALHAACLNCGKGVGHCLGGSLAYRKGICCELPESFAAPVSVVWRRRRTRVAGAREATSARRRSAETDLRW